VPFCHITSRVPTDKHQTLLQDKGGMGFPHLVFLDENGEVVAEQQDRSVDGFAATVRDLNAWRALKERVDGGDESAANDLFLAGMRLGKISHKDATAQLERLEGLTEAQRKEAEQLLVNLEFDGAVKSVTSRQEMEAVLERAAAMYAAKRIPSGNSAPSFWSLLMRKADNDQDPALFAVCVTELKKMFGDKEEYKETFEQLDQQLEEMRAAQKGKKDGADKIEKVDKEKNGK
jgi:hypothetical protein